MNKTCVVHLSVDEIAGGAARAANRIHNTLLEFGINSRMVVLYKDSDSDFVTSIRVNKVALFFAIKINAFIRIIFASKKLGAFSAGLIGTLKVKNQKELKQADIISLHWVPGGFLSIFSIAKKYVARGGTWVKKGLRGVGTTR